MIDKRGRSVNINARFLSTVLQRGKKFISDSYQLKVEKGKVIPISLTVSPLYSRNTVIGATFTFRNILREQLREQQKNDFISIVSHELKTPITSIKAYNQLLLRNMDKTSTQRSMNIVTKMDGELSRLSQLINNFLDISRVQSGRLRLEREVFKLQDLLYDVVNNVHSTQKHKIIALKGKTQALVFADRDRIEQVLMNLITNAESYSPKGKKIAISLRLRRNEIVVGIREYGKGMPEEVHKKISDRFYQIGNEKISGMFGMGLDLYISANIIRQHGGKMWLVSRKGKGSTFYFTLPFV